MMATANELAQVGKDAIEAMRAKLVEQVGTIASLNKSADEMAVIISAQEYKIKQLTAQLDDYKEAGPRPAADAADREGELARFAGDADDLYEKMRARKERLVSGQGGADEHRKQAIIEFARRAVKGRPD